MEDIIRKVNSGERLAFAEAGELFSAMVTGGCTESQMGSVLVSMRFRGETSDELAALVTTLNRHKRIFHHQSRKTVDTCGTGGDGKSTVNISTAAGLILSSMGYPVVKHGNSAQSGKVGSADILKRLGINIEKMRDKGESCLERHGFVFMFAPHYHPALAGIGKVRREIKVPTIFNFSGPLVNPADPDFQLIGIPSLSKIDFIADVLIKTGKNNITVYSSRDGYDEVSSNEITSCVTVRDGIKHAFDIDPADFFKPFPMPVVNNDRQAEELFLEGIKGEREDIACIFAVNTALALNTMGEASLEDGFAGAMEAIRSGKTMEKLNAIREFVC